MITVHNKNNLKEKLWEKWKIGMLSDVESELHTEFHSCFFFLKLVSAIFYQVFISSQMKALQKLWKILLFHLKSSLRSLKKEKRYDIETLSIDRVLNKERFY